MQARAIKSVALLLVVVAWVAGASSVSAFEHGRDLGRDLHGRIGGVGEGTARAAERAGRIIGRVLDQETREPLPGANVVVQGTTIGAATDAEGRFSIPSAPSGLQTLVVSYIGYDRQEVPVTVPEGGTVEVNVELSWGGVEGEEVVVTAQVAGQLAAINEQFRDPTVKNVVSRDRIQELPDNNAAESIGRLPGVAIERSGGEARKVAIRGLAPKYNTVTVNGVRVPTTDPNDRSVDLSLVSSNILDGIEVRKAITPDMDADVIGGNVDLRLRNAPVGWSVDLLAQGGYTGLQEDLGNYKVVGTLSNRFVEDRLGAIATFNFDGYNRSADKAGINWNSDDANPATGVRDTRFNDFNLREETVFRQRSGGSLLLDYTIPSGRLTGNAFYNSIDNDALVRRYAPSVNSLNSSVEDNDTRTSILTSGLGIEQDFGRFEYDAQVSYTRSRFDAPHNYVWEFAKDGSALSVGRAELYGLSADSVYSLINDDSTSALTSIWVDANQLDEEQVGLQLNVQTPFQAGTLVSGYVKVGGKLRWLDRVYDRERTGRQGLRYADGNSNTSRCVQQVLGPEWTERYDLADSLYDTPGLPVELLLLDYGRTDEFLEGQYGLGPVADEALLMELTEALQSDACRSEYLPNSIASLGQDYDGIERYQAGFVMAELNIGRYVTVIPGIRYERDFSRYNGQRFREVINAFRDAPPADLEDLQVERDNAFWLPMIHVDIRPKPWMSVRLARTETISRPGYSQYAPITSINGFSSFIRAAASQLRPSQAVNYDASVQLVSGSFGLIGVSAFHKTIDDLILEVEYPTQLFVVDGDTTIVGVPEGSNVPTGWLVGASPQLQTTVNNDEPAKYWGYELEWQTNFPYLPGVLRGLVLSLNYTRGFSETTYHYYRKERTYIPGSRPPQYTYEMIDTTRTGRMPGQAAHIFNATLGFDYKGFSTRLSYLYQSNTASYISPRERLIDSYVGPYSRFDLSIRQKVGVGFEVFANLNNLNNRPDRSFTGQNTADNDYEFNETYPSYRELYGYTIDVGARYRF
jgi:TonB-dependent receptor